VEHLTSESSRESRVVCVCIRKQREYMVSLRLLENQNGPYRMKINPFA